MDSIILIDDDEQFAKSFTNEVFAQAKITVAHQRSLQGLKKLLPALGHKYAAVVLDIKGLTDDGQAKEDASFITAALKYLDTTMPNFPRFILTGDESEFDTLKKYYQQEKLFLKKPDDQTRLLQELNYCVINAEPLRIKRENPNVFQVFDRNLLPSANEIKIINVLKGITETNTANFKGIIADIREIHEEIYKALNKRNKLVIPDKFINPNGSPSFKKDLHSHLAGNPGGHPNFAPTSTIYQDSTISSHTKLIQMACSEYLHNTSKANYFISIYTVRALINSLAEMMIWSSQY